MTRAAIEASRNVIDSQAAVAVWEVALEAPEWDGTPTWIHADLLRPNLLIDRGRIAAVIDFGGVGVGDGAADVIAAWSVFGQRGRATFRAALEVDDGTWNRARGYALHQALLIIPYYAIFGNAVSNRSAPWRGCSVTSVEDSLSRASGENWPTSNLNQIQQTT